MRMHNATYIGTQGIDHKVHGDLARDIPVSVLTAPFQVHHHHILRLHHALTTAGGSREDGSVLEPDGEVPICGGDILPLMHQVPQADNFVSIFAFRLHLGIKKGGGKDMVAVWYPTFSRTATRDQSRCARL